MSTTNALLVIAKRPTPGQTKTRLSPPLTAEQAAALYECFLVDTLDLVPVLLGASYTGTLVESSGGWEVAFWTLAPVCGAGAVAGVLSRVK